MQYSQKGLSEVDPLSPRAGKSTISKSDQKNRFNKAKRESVYLMDTRQILNNSHNP